jgi:sulfur-carrier protein
MLKTAFLGSTSNLIDVYEKSYMSEVAIERAPTQHNAHMPRVIFAPQLQRHVPCPAQDVSAANLFDALIAAFVVAPAMRHYVLDEQSRVRKHVAVFINGTLIRDRVNLSIALSENDRVDVIQALSGG